MLNRFIELFPFLSLIDDDEVLDLLSTRGEQDEVNVLCDKLDLDSVTKAFQRASLLLFEAIVMFNEMMQKKSTTKSRVDAN